MTNTTAPKSTAADQAARFLAECREAGFEVSGGGGVVTISKSFTPGDRAAYVECDMTGPLLLCQVPKTGPGSTWGTDGGSIGGHAGLVGGYYRLKASGCSKRFTAALVKALAR